MRRRGLENSLEPDLSGPVHQPQSSKRVTWRTPSAIIIVSVVLLFVGWQTLFYEDNFQESNVNSEKHFKIENNSADIQPKRESGPIRIQLHSTNASFEWVRREWPPFSPCEDEFGDFEELSSKIESGNKVFCSGNSEVSTTFGELYWHGRNVMIDFTKRHVSATESRFSPGFILADCDLRFRPENSRLSAFVSSAAYGQNDLACTKNISEPTILITRDDCGNAFHGFADFLEYFSMLKLMGISTERARAIVVDTRLMCHGTNPNDSTPREIDCLTPSCPMDNSWNAMARAGVHKGIEFEGHRVCFDNLYSLMGNIAVIWSDKRCSAGNILQSYRLNMLDFFGLPSTTSRPVLNRMTNSIDVKVLLIIRNRKPFSNNRAGRRFRNIKELSDFISGLKLITNPEGTQEIKVEIRLTVIDVAELEFKNQVELFSSVDILIGMHGAGLTQMIFTPPHCHVIEIQPYTWDSELFINLAIKLKRPITHYRNPYPENHHDDSCPQSRSGKSFRDLYVCTSSTNDETTVNVTEFSQILGQTVWSLAHPEAENI